MSPVDAVKELNFRFGLGIEIKPDPNQYYYNVQQERMVELERSLTEKHFQYLALRGIEAETVRKFNIGGREDKIFIPIRNEQGKVVAINSRTMLDNVHPKYVHSETSPIFNKNEVMACLYESLSVPSSSVIVTEGQLDAIASIQAGWAAVACLTSKISKVQVQKLTSLYSTIILGFDDDEAGKNGAIKAYQDIKSHDPHVTIKFIDMCGSKDLAEYFLKSSTLYFTDLAAWGQLRLNEKDLLDMLALEHSHIELRRASNLLSKIYGVKADDVFHDILAVKNQKIRV